jgi:hypothetical protein
VLLHYLPGKEQAQAGSFCLTGIFIPDAVKLQEYPFPFFERYAWTFVGHLPFQDMAGLV